jgi:hypothetical protein
VSTAQTAAVWALFAFAIFGVPGFWVGWYVGRRSLRAALARELLPVVHEVRITVAAQPSPLALAGRLPADPDVFDTVPMLLWSEHAAALDAHEREVRTMIAETERFPDGKRRRW